MQRKQSNVTQLSTEDYNKFIMKVLNEDENDLAIKLESFNDDVDLYFRNKDFNQIVNATLDLKEHMLLSDEFHLIEGYLNENYELIHSQLHSEKLYNSIVNNADWLENVNNIKNGEQHYEKLVNFFKDYHLNANNIELTTDNITMVYERYNQLNSRLEVIDFLNESLKEYESKYMNDNYYLNDEYIGNIEHYSHVEALIEKWGEIKNNFENEKVFLHEVLNGDCSRYLKFAIPDVFNKWEPQLSSDQTELSEYIYKTKKLTDIQVEKELIPTANINQYVNIAEAINGYGNIYQSATNMKVDLDMQSYYKNLDYQDSNLSKLLDNQANSSFEKIVSNMNRKLDMDYGISFFDEKLDVKNKNLILNTANMYVLNMGDSYRNGLTSLSSKTLMYDLANLEVEGKEDKFITSFWEQKSSDLLKEYIKEKGYSSDVLQNTILKLSDLNDTLNKIDDILDTPINDLSRRTLNNIQSNIDKSLSIYQEIDRDISIDVLKLEPYDEYSNYVEQRPHNILSNNRLMISHLENSLSEVKQYIQDNEKFIIHEEDRNVKESSLEFEHEL